MKSIPLRIKEYLHYSPETGIFKRLKSTYRKGKQSDFGICGELRHNGYRYISFDNNTYPAHRLAFWWITGEEGLFDIDHINGIRDDNRIINLRKATRSENLANSKLSCRNKTGVKGVYWHETRKRYRAVVFANGKTQWSGHFINLEDAKIAVRAAREKYHGEFTNHG